MAERGEMIQAIARFRPRDEIEEKEDCEVAWEIQRARGIIQQLKSNDNSLAVFANFNHVLGPSSTNMDTYKRIQNIVRSSFEGKNGSVLAYGQTASGKTFTIKGTPDNPGIIPLAVLDLFKLMKAKTNMEFHMRVSYIQIYKKQLTDLLDPAAKLKVREDAERNFFVENISTHAVTTKDEVIELLMQGEDRRRYGETEMSKMSSRSHVIFRIILESKLVGKSAGNKVRVSHLNFVDLAGSERFSKTKAVGERMEESKTINSDLLFLGILITSLKNNPFERKGYRNSPLTQVLQPSLGGNARTAIICCLSPVLKNAHETVNTLRFGMNATQVVNHAKINLVNSDRFDGGNTINPNNIEIFPEDQETRWKRQLLFLQNLFSTMWTQRAETMKGKEVSCRRSTGWELGTRPKRHAPSRSEDQTVLGTEDAEFFKTQRIQAQVRRLEEEKKLLEDEKEVLEECNQKLTELNQEDMDEAGLCIAKIEAMEAEKNEMEALIQEQHDLILLLTQPTEAMVSALPTSRLRTLEEQTEKAHSVFQRATVWRTVADQLGLDYNVLQTPNWKEELRQELDQERSARQRFEEQCERQAEQLHESEQECMAAQEKLERLQMASDLLQEEKAKNASILEHLEKEEKQRTELDATCAVQKKKIDELDKNVLALRLKLMHTGDKAKVGKVRKRRPGRQPQLDSIPEDGFTETHKLNLASLTFADKQKMAPPSRRQTEMFPRRVERNPRPLVHTSPGSREFRQPRLSRPQTTERMSSKLRPPSFPRPNGSTKASSARRAPSENLDLNLDVISASKRKPTGASLPRNDSAPLSLAGFYQEETA